MKWWIALLSVCLLLSGCLNDKAHSQEKSGRYTARVVHVSDGDSIYVRDNQGEKHKIRLAYIDAPELKQTFGRDAHRHLRDLIAGKQVTVEAFTHDQYGREVSRIFLNGKDINWLQINEGMAWHYRSIAKREQNKADFQRYQKAEKHARKNRLGLWKNKKIIPPWRWRYQHRR